MESPEKIFESFSKLNVLIIGDVMLDSYIWGAVERISPEAPVPIINVRKKDFRLGGAANVALNVHALGATPILCALIGDDEDGKKLLQRLDDKEISKDGIVTSSFRPTTVKTRIIASQQHVVRVDEESEKVVNQEEEKLLLERIEKLMPACHVIVFEDYDKGQDKSIFAMLLDQDRFTTARRIAPTILVEAQVSGEMNPSTKLHELLDCFEKLSLLQVC
jgi:rfaE bifunctional protein kinase chain/domain